MMLVSSVLGECPMFSFGIVVCLLLLGDFSSCVVLFGA